MARVGRIWKFTEVGNENNAHFYPSFNAKNYVVKNVFEKYNPGKRWEAEIVLTTEAKTLSELREVSIQMAQVHKKQQEEAVPAPEEEPTNEFPPYIINEVINFQTDEGKINFNTAKTYIYSAKRYILWAGLGYHDYLFFDMQKIKKYANELSKNTQQETSFWCAIQVFNRIISADQINQCKHLKAESRGHYIAKRIEEIRDVAEITPQAIRNEKGDQATKIFNDMKQVWEDIKDKKSYTYMLASWYILIPPKRPSTLASISIKPLEEEHNYLDLETGTLHMNVSKTIKYKGKNRQQLPESLISIIKAFLAVNPQITDYLFNRNINTLTQQVRRIFGIGNNDIRHTFVTYASYQKMDMREVMRMMDSSEITAAVTYNDANK